MDLHRNAKLGLSGRYALVCAGGMFLEADTLLLRAGFVGQFC